MAKKIAFEDPIVEDIGSGRTKRAKENAVVPYPEGPESDPVPKTRAERVRQKHEKSLLAIEGVQGVGLQMGRVGEDVIVIYIRDQGVKKALPNSLDGIPVETSIVGEFKAY